MELDFEREWQAALARLHADDMGRALIGQPESADFLTNDVLGLSQHPEVKRAIGQAANLHGVGARASRLLGGDHGLLTQAEDAAAKWVGTEAALLCASGFQANLALLSTLPQAGDALLCDALNHASLIDGARLSRARVTVYKHADLADLERALKAHQHAARRWVATESLFGMDGDLAPLLGIVELCQRYDARLIVDEAHAAGILGPQGRGACADIPGIETVLAARLVTGGKALGVAGAFILGSQALRSYLIHKARPFVFSTGIPLPVAAALTAAIGCAQAMDAERARILAGASRLASELDLPEPAGAVVPIPCGGAADALDLAQRLRGLGLHLHAVRPPTVPEGTSRLRVVVHANAQAEDLDHLAKVVRAERKSAVETSPAPDASTKPIVIIGTDTDVGKTVASAFLLHGICAQGLQPAYWKPIQSGMPSDTRAVQALTQGLEVQFHPPGIELALPKSPDQAARQEGRHIHENRIQSRLQHWRTEGPNPLVVETAGGLCVPWNDHYQTLDWIAANRPHVVLVTRSGLGTLNHTRLTLRALSDIGVTPMATIIVGEPHPENRAGIANLLSGPVLELPWMDPLDSETLGQAARAHSFDWIPV